jgi:hypothetical protein
MPYPFLLDLRVARETGYDGVIVIADKLRRYLADGFTAEQAKPRWPEYRCSELTTSAISSGPVTLPAHSFWPSAKTPAGSLS